MTAYYNDINPHACGVLHKQIAAGDIPTGVVDERDIRDVQPEDLAGFDHVHLFAGIGGFPLGFCRAGVPDDFAIWTGGDPCQGNSKGGGVWNRRHEDVAVHFLRLVDEIRPRLVLRENPASTRGDAPWPWHRFRAGLESLGYTVLPFRLRACCLGADHPGERLFLLAEFLPANRQRPQGIDWQREPSRVIRRTTGDRARGQPRNDLSPSRICRVGDGLPDRVDRTQCVGNSVDPRMSEWIGRNLMSAAHAL